MFKRLSTFKRLSWIVMVSAGLVALCVVPQQAAACPMCKEALDTSTALPRAYMMSILFMLGVPATVLTGFSVGFYRLSKKQSQIDGDEALEASTDEFDEPQPPSES